MTNTANNRFNVSISVLLVVAIGGLVSLAAGAVLILSVYANFKNTSELVVESAEAFMENLEDDVTQYLLPAQNLVDYLVKQAANGNFDPSIKQEAVLVLSGALAAAPQISNIAIWQPDGRELLLQRGEDQKLVFESEDNLNAQDLKSFLARVRDGRKTVWNQPFRVGRNTLITVVAPLHRGEQYLGVAGAAISLRQLSALVESLSKAYGTTGFILYGKDHLLAHARLPELPVDKLSRDNPLHRVDALDDPVVRNFLDQPVEFTPESKAFVARDFFVGGRPYVVLTRNFEEFGAVPWILGQYSPRSDWDTQIRRLDRSVMGGVALLILAILAAVFLARSIAAPVRSTAAAALKVGALDLEQIERLPPSRITELNNQAMAFNQMLDGLSWFQTYVPRQLVRRLVRKSDQISIESRERELTVMFTDIIGFTAMSETKTPTAIADMLNRHFEILYQCIEAEGGTLDKYIGDAVMAFWGAPEDQPDHAARACRAALAAKTALEEMAPEQRVKIAIHTGPLIVGNIGAVGRMNYTVIGDTVNTCSRIEKLAGELDAGEAAIMLISDATAAQIGNGFQLEGAGDFQLKGRANPVTVYRLMDQNSPDQSI